jgi:hypothetical protein
VLAPHRDQFALVEHRFYAETDGNLEEATDLFAARRRLAVSCRRCRAKPVAL